MLEVVKRSARFALMGLAVSALGAAVAVRSPASGGTVAAEPRTSADKEAWAVIDRMSSGERLWYRVGALMARRVEDALGRQALVDLIIADPARFVATARATMSAPEH